MELGLFLKIVVTGLIGKLVEKFIWVKTEWTLFDMAYRIFAKDPIVTTLVAIIGIFIVFNLCCWTWKTCKRSIRRLFRIIKLWASVLTACGVVYFIATKI